MSLIIVESPTKARTFNRVLKSSTDKKNYYVFATVGHIRDLPSNRMAIDFEKQFKPDYEIVERKKKTVAELKKLGKENSEIILATDPDREGESIAYHAAYILGKVKEKWPTIELKDGVDVKRIVFHEITARALQEALEKPESIRLDLVKAQQARRILDRIVGYELSPLLWKKIGKNWLSAGRVQSIALRLIVEREKEIRNFKLENYIQIYGEFSKNDFQIVKSASPTPEVGKVIVKAKLVAKGGVAYEQKFTLKLFAGDYQYTKTTINKNNVEEIKKDLLEDKYAVSKIKEEIQNRFPPPPHTTSLLQQDAFYKFGFSSRMTMKLAQDLYEEGLITYHRTDSFNLSTYFVFRAKDYIEKKYGKNYALEKPRGYRTKSKMAQEAHESIRPTSLDKEPNSLKSDKKITQNHKKLFGMIFNRAVSTQMKEAQIKNIKITINGQKGYEFESEMQKVIFDGFLRLLNPIYVEKNQMSTNLKEKDELKLNVTENQENQTKPPPRYNEASIIKILEEKGIGRPSTYAPIISLIQTKNYVEKVNRYFSPTKLGEVISDYLSGAFPDIFNLDFTASMEDNLDKVANGEADFINLLSEFNTPFQKVLAERKKDTKVIDVEEEVNEKCLKCGKLLVIRYSKFGKFMACSGYPKCKFTKPFLYFVNNKFCPEDKGRLVVRFTKTRKKFYGCENYPKCKYSSWKLNYDRKT